MRTALLLLSVLASGIVPAPGAGNPAQPRPNILVILADDMGFSDAGCYGGEIATPNLDALARGGLRFSQFYNTARCWPSRAALLTGYYAQQTRRDTVPGVRSGAQGARPAWARLLPDLLQPFGYRSYHSGKWHVDGLRRAGGFEHSYCVTDDNRYFAPREHFKDDVKLPPVVANSDFYTTTAIAEQAIQQLKEHAAHFPGQPFFEYLCFTSPHFPLQARPEDIARYRETYRKGWDRVRADRWERMKKLGLAAHDLPPVERDVGPPYHFPDAYLKLGAGETNRPVPWVELNEVQREFQSAKMAVHAAMVDRMDHEIGRVLDQIRAMGAWDNTLVLFLSDNGASAEIMVRGDGHDAGAAPGSAGSFVCLGPGWSSVANTPFRRHKTWVHEGGISTPLIMHWPRGIAARGEWRRTPGHLIDLAPTLVQLAGGAWPEAWAGHPMPTPPGKSLVPALAKDSIVKRDELWWLHEGNRALRVGDWKIVAAGTNAAWELYNLKLDRGEMHNLAGKEPGRVRSMADQWQRRTDDFFAVARANAPIERARP